MYKKIGLLLFSLAMLWAIPFAALGIGPPHDTASKTNGTSNSVGCTSCHRSGPVDSGPFNNVCTGCHMHSSGSPITSAFYLEDASNIYNRFNFANYTSKKKMWNSHSWGSGSEVAPEAGAGSPTGDEMNPAILGTNLSCARCHDPHLDRYANYPFLRVDNSDDNLCRNCHAARDHSPENISVNQSGTHPVNFRYSSAISKVRTKPLDYYTTTRNANPANPTSSMKFKNGKVQCTTCHGVHYADSNSRHAVGRDSWQIMSASRGMLLRTDTFGQTDADSSVNICTNCHNKPNHQTYSGSKASKTNKMMGIQCVDCHTAHVEYIKPEDKAQVGTENEIFNIYLLRRYMNYSAGKDSDGKNKSFKLDTYRRKAFLTSTSGTVKLRNGQGTAICQTCHNLPDNIPDHLTVSTKNQCLECHGSMHPKTPPLDCDSCHGRPPQHTVTGNRTGGYAAFTGISSYYTVSNVNGKIYKNESTAGHPTHSAGKPYNLPCIQCHNRTTTPSTHLNKKYQDVRFDSPGAFSRYGQFVAGNSSSTCSNMYCHSYGTGVQNVSGNIVVNGAKSVSWAEDVRDTIVKSQDRCVKCHNGVFTGSQTFNNMSTNAHFQHVSRTGKNITCNVCHSATVSGNTTISNYDNHVNGVRDLSSDKNVMGGLLVSQLSGQNQLLSGTTCTTYCHSDSLTPQSPPPNWKDRSTGKCNSCHLTAESTEIISSNGHLTHFSSALSGSTYGPRLAGNTNCNICHKDFAELGSTHVNGTVDVNAVGIKTCTTQCHRNAQPIWNIRTDPQALEHRLDCSTCHDGQISYDTRPGFNSISAPRKSMFNFTSLGHGQKSHSGATWPEPRYLCTECHDNNSKHISGVRGDSTRLISYSSSQNGLCAHCHNNKLTVKTDLRQNLPTHVTTKSIPAGQGQPAEQAKADGNCSLCHDVHGTANYFNLVESIKYNTLSSAKPISFKNGANEDLAKKNDTNFVKASGDGLCQICHTKVKYFMRYSRNYGYPGQAGYVYKYPHPSGGQNCLGCHNHNDKKPNTFAFRTNGACDACHGYPPVRSLGSARGHQNNYSTAKLQNYSGGGGVHDVAGHLPATVKASNGWNEDCKKCHFNQGNHDMLTSAWDSGKSTAEKKTNVNVEIDPQYLFNSSKSFGYNKINSDKAENSGSCSNVSCHFQHTPRWGEDK